MNKSRSKKHTMCTRQRMLKEVVEMNVDQSTYFLSLTPSQGFQQAAQKQTTYDAVNHGRSSYLQMAGDLGPAAAMLFIKNQQSVIFSR